MKLHFKNQTLDLVTPKVMGVLNVTPDSFSDGGRFIKKDDALRHAEQLYREGAAILDIGGESTRPGAQPVASQEELDRVIPVIECLQQQFDIPLSIDTSKAEVMQAAVSAGASMINDVSALQNAGALETAVRLEVPVCLMHMQGQPRSMQDQPSYQNVVEDVKQFLLTRARICHDAGIAKEQIILDPGFGFGKTLAHNLSLLKHTGEFAGLGYPLLVGVSRKRMISQLLDLDLAANVSERTAGSLIAAMHAVYQGANIIRTHNVKETVQACKIVTAVQAAD